jgi:adenylate cyclase class 2
MKSPGNREVEVKLRVPDLAATRRRLARLGLRPVTMGRVYERNTLFDTPQGGLAKHGQLLRLRVEEPPGKSGGRDAGKNRLAVLTYKGPSEQATPEQAAQARRYKVREEIEAGVADPEQVQAILEALGLRGWFRYEKFRTHYRLSASFRWALGLEVALDETPIGNYIELEGPPGAIDRLAELLGYTPGDYITKSYVALYLADCRKQGIQPADMVFPARKK